MTSTLTVNGAWPTEFGLRSSRIFTMDHAHRVVDGWLHVRDGRILGVTEGEPPQSVGATVFDLGDKPVLPGFVDPHVHLEMSAAALWGTVDCHTPPCGSIGELVAQLHDHRHLREQRGGWLIGQGGLFADRRFTDGRLPTRDDLDKVSTRFPIAVRFGAHVTVLNSVALDLAREHGLPTTGDAHIHTDGTGRWTGILHELYYALPIPAMTPDELRRATAATAHSQLTRHGVTTIGEITNTVQGMELLADAAGGEVPQQVRAFVWSPGTMSVRATCDRQHAGGFPRTGSFEVAGVKIFVDGGFSAAGAAVLKPYRSDPSSRGRMAYSRSELVDLVRDTDEAGLQVAAHANGERAQWELCRASVLARAGATGPRPGLRLEHGGNVLTHPETAERWAEAGAVIVPQAGFIWTMGSFLPEYLGDYAADNLFPFRSLLDQGMSVASSSDGAGSELLQFNPMFGVQCAVGRMSCTGQPVAPAEAVSVTEALAMHTRFAAEALGVADTRGSLEPGKRADLVVLERDPTQVDTGELAGLLPEQVLFAGVPSDPAGPKEPS
ncbi:amidohydrolase family protein [Streptomyces sp. SID8352]|uniref:amidohydrolase n=1 Tax=Streptomyces sp. SID8352 TaxID=2690338 RepID=UPI00136FB3FD|nr:amidohydrolase family protein [Streptomyces sp. SID8352]MYU22498.1 amidohydrolase family protein [Streptomyces sp. SID8352]